jgi:RNA polymerase sigma factor (sigma-70 family)
VANGGIKRFVGQIRRAAAETAFDGLTDAELLLRYVDSGDEAAFEVIARRHGPLVLAVCRRVLGDSHGADDAFQATFLVLARKARSIRKSESVSSWLHGVARRVAARARESARTRRWYERRWQRVPAADAFQEVAWRDVGAILDEEIRQLPERIRAPFVLCYFEGASNDSAARTLGCPSGTVMSRLSRARELLRARLTRRGLALSAGFLATTPSEAAIRVPLALAETALNAVAAARGAQEISAAVAALAASVVRPRWLTAGVAAASGIGLAVALAIAPIGDKEIQQMSVATPRTVPEVPSTDLDRLQGSWAVIASVFEGAADLPASMQGAKAVFRGNRLTLAGPKNPPQELSVTLDPSANPKALDVTPVDGPAKGMTSRGIYRLDHDTLEFCVPAAVSRMSVRIGQRGAGDAAREAVLPSRAVRPDAFAAPRGSFRRLFTLRRIEPAG